jgi:hypothetical protein
MATCLWHRLVNSRQTCEAILFAEYGDRPGSFRFPFRERIVLQFATVCPLIGVVIALQSLDIRRVNIPDQEFGFVMPGIVIQF